MEPLEFFQEELKRDYENQQELLRQLPKLPRPIARAVIEDLIETCVAARIRNPPRANAAQKKPTGAPKVSAPKPPGEYLNTAQAAELANKTPATIRSWCRLKLFPLADRPARDGRPTRIYSIPKEDFKCWLKNRTRNALPEG